MHKKITSIVIGIVLAALPFVASAQVQPTVQATAPSATAADLQVQISSLLAQLQVLQMKLASMSGSGGASGGTSGTSCQTFSRSLSLGAQGSDVTALQQLLSAQGYLTVSASGYFGTLTQTALGQWQAYNGIALAGSGGFGIFGPLSRAYMSKNCVGMQPQTPPTTPPSSTIQQINAPGSVALSVGGIAEVRNENFYFTLQSLSATSATIQITPVGCWNSFPSDTPPQIRCMIAVVPIPPQIFSVGQTYTLGNRSITLGQLTSTTATFTVNIGPTTTTQ